MNCLKGIVLVSVLLFFNSCKHKEINGFVVNKIYSPSKLVRVSLKSSTLSVKKPESWSITILPSANAAMVPSGNPQDTVTVTVSHLAFDTYEIGQYYQSK